MKKKEIIEKIEQLEGKLSEIDKLTEIANRFEERYSSFYKYCADSFKKMNERYEEFCKNVKITSVMINELKGVVAMSRAALDEGRRFSQMHELPNLCAQLSLDIAEATKMIARMQDTSQLIYESSQTLVALRDALVSDRSIDKR